MIGAVHRSTAMKTLLVPLLAVASLTACATNRMSDTDRLAMYQALSLIHI